MSKAAQLAALIGSGQAQGDKNLIINGVQTGVPLDPANSDYAEIMRQVNAGELTIADAD